MDVTGCNSIPSARLIFHSKHVLWNNPSHHPGSQPGCREVTPRAALSPSVSKPPLWSISPGSQPGFPASAVKAGSRGCPTALVTLGASPFPLAAPRGMRERKVPGAYSVFSLEEGSLLENTWNLLGLEYGVKVLPPAGSPSINSGKGFVLTTLNCAGFVP